MPASLGVRSLNVGKPVNWAAPLNMDLRCWWMALPHRASGRTWFDLTRGFAAPFTSLSPTTATAGWGGTTRQGGLSEVRYQGTGYTRTTLLVEACMSDDQGTLTMWARPTGSSPSVANSWLGRTIVRDGDEYLGILQATIGGLDRLWAYGYGNISTDSRVGLPYTPGQWHHLGWVHVGGQLYGYLNGILVGNVAMDTVSIPSTTVWTIGQGRDAGTHWQGALDDMRTYARALTDSEMRALYVASSTGYQQELNWLTWPPGWASVAAAAFALDDEPWWYQIREVA